MSDLLYFQSSSLLMHLGKQAEDGESSWTPDTHLEDQVELQAPGFIPAQLQSLQPLGE